jgi:two-component system, cell cycle response regulator
VKIDPFRILLVEDDIKATALLKSILAEAGPACFELTVEVQLRNALAQLSNRDADVVLLDLTLPDCPGIEAVKKIAATFPDLPSVALVLADDEALGVQAVQTGAEDYLVKGDLTRNLLVRTMRSAVDRHRLKGIIRGLSLTDDLTGLYNRRGLFALAREHLKLAFRKKRTVLLLLAEVDRLDVINRDCGHLEGDLALIETSELLRDTFRDSDVLARVGGDEFAVLAIEASDDKSIATRLQQALRNTNALEERSYKLALNISGVRSNPEREASIQEMLEQAAGQLRRVKAEQKK